jgi:hypothetical protein
MIENTKTGFIKLFSNVKNVYFFYLCKNYFYEISILEGGIC